MSRKKPKYTAVITPVVKEEILYTDKNGVEAVKFLKVQPSGFQYCIRYPKGYVYQEEDLPISHTVKGDGASPEVLLTLATHALRDKPQILLVDQIARMFIELGTKILTIRDQSEGDGDHPHDTLRTVRDFLANDDTFEGQLEQYLTDLERCVEENV